MRFFVQLYSKWDLPLTRDLSAIVKSPVFTAVSKPKELLKVKITGSHVHRKSCNISAKRRKIVLLQTTNRKWHAAYRITTIFDEPEWSWLLAKLPDFSVPFFAQCSNWVGGGSIRAGRKASIPYTVSALVGRIPLQPPCADSRIKTLFKIISLNQCSKTSTVSWFLVQHLSNAAHARSVFDS